MEPSVSDFFPSDFSLSSAAPSDLILFALVVFMTAVCIGAALGDRRALRRAAIALGLLSAAALALADDMRWKGLDAARSARGQMGGASAAPLHDLYAGWIFLLVAALAWSLGLLAPLTLKRVMGRF